MTLSLAEKICGFNTFLLLKKFLTTVKQCRRISDVFQDSRIRKSYSTKKKKNELSGNYYNVKSDRIIKVISGSLGCRKKRAGIALSLRNKKEAGSFCGQAGD